MVNEQWFTELHFGQHRQIFFYNTVQVEGHSLISGDNNEDVSGKVHWGLNLTDKHICILLEGKLLFLFFCYI